MHNFLICCQTFFFHFTERLSNYNFPYEFSHPDEYLYNLADEGIDNSQQPIHLNPVKRRSLDSMIENGMSSFPSLKTRFVRSVIERQTGERFQTVRKRCRRVVQRTCGSQAASRVYETDKRTSSAKQQEHLPFFHNGN